MTGRYYIVWTLKRGVVDPPEPVDDATQQILEMSATLDHIRQRLPIERDVFWQEVAS